MHTLFLDGERYQSPRALHSALQRMLHFPPHYGHNADALYDCLTGRREPLRVVILSRGEGEAARALGICISVFEDAGAEVVMK